MIVLGFLTTRRRISQTGIEWYLTVINGGALGSVKLDSDWYIFPSATFTNAPSYSWLFLCVIKVTATDTDFFKFNLRKRLFYNILIPVHTLVHLIFDASSVHFNHKQWSIACPSWVFVKFDKFVEFLLATNPLWHAANIKLKNWSRK